MLPKMPEKPKHQLIKTLVGGIYYLGLIFSLVWLVQLGFLPEQFITWIRRSTNPSATLYLAATAASGVLWFVSKLIVGGTVKIESSGSLKFLNSFAGLLKYYIIGVYKALEIAIAIISVVCGLYVWFSNPFCSSLAVTFEVVTNGDALQLASGNSLFINAGDSFLITAKALKDGETFACAWEAGGSAVEFITTPHACSTNVASVSGLPGESLLVVRTKNVCNQTLVFPIKIFTKAAGN